MAELGYRMVAHLTQLTASPSNVGSEARLTRRRTFRDAALGALLDVVAASTRPQQAWRVEDWCFGRLWAVIESCEAHTEGLIGLRRIGPSPSNKRKTN